MNMHAYTSTLREGVKETKGGRGGERLRREIGGEKEAVRGRKSKKEKKKERGRGKGRKGEGERENKK